MDNVSEYDPEQKSFGQARIVKAVDVSLMRDAGDIIEKARIQAGNIAKQAGEEADRIIEAAQQEASLIIDRSVNEGRELVHNIDREERIKAEKKSTDYLLNLTSDLQNQLTNIDGHLIDLVGNAIKKIIGEINETDLIERAVTQGLQELKDQYRLILLVHSSQFDAAQVAVSRFHSFVGHEEGPIHRVEVDADLRPGECFLLSSGGLLDISIATQVANILEVLRMRPQGAG